MSFKDTDLGKIPIEWELKSVYELIEENILDKPLDGNHGGIHPTRKDFVDKGIPFVMASDLKNGTVDYRSCKYITDETSKGLKKGFAREGDVLLTHKATIGRVAVVKNINTPYIVLTPQVTYYRVLDYCKLDNIFLRYYFSWKKFNALFTAWAQGSSTRAYLGITAQQKLPIILPTIEEQKNISKILASIDEKIETNNQINKKLEEMAQAIFKQWFVDFEFPNENGESYKSSGGEMIESEMGMIPKGCEVWDIETLTELIIDYRGKTPKKLGRDWSPTGIIALSAKSIKNGRLVNLDQANRVDKELYSLWMKDELEYGDILLTSEAPLGELYFLASDDKYCLSQRLYAIRANRNHISSEILYMYLKTPSVMKDIENRATGTTVTGIRQSELRKVRVLKPKKYLQDQFQEFISTVLKKINLNEEENFRLINLRDTLLPKLMSGEIRVSLDN